MEYISVKDFFQNQSILITGGLGTIGKSIVEKLLRSCPGVGNIYLLIRVKPNQDAKQRTRELLDSQLFDDVRHNAVHQLEKVIPVEGDITKSGLGISEVDRKTLIKNVSIIFHSAATTRFNEHLRTALLVNVFGTKHIIEFSHQIPNLKAFIHVSTAFCQWGSTEIREEVYPMDEDLEKLKQMNTILDDRMIDDVTPRILKNHPNTYSFTKAFAEWIVENEKKSFPAAIVRPSVVLSSYKEPKPGWYDTLIGFTGVVAAIAKGYNRTTFMHGNVLLQVIPLDVVVNMLICTAWKTAIYRQDKVPLYNCCVHKEHLITSRKFVNEVLKNVKEYPSKDIIWYPDFYLNDTPMITPCYIYLGEFLPAFLIDTILRLRGSKPQMVRLCTRLLKTSKYFERYIITNWDFHTHRMRELNEMLSAEDREMFMFDTAKLDWPEYIKNYVLGIRQYVFKEDPDTIPAARTRLKILYCLSRGLWLILLMITFFVGYFLYYSLSNMFSE